MAYGADTQGGGVFAWPDVPELGYQTWDEMSGMSAAHPLVGGQAGEVGYGAGTRQVAVAQSDPTAASTSGAPAAAHWKELGNLRGNPTGWVLLILIAYLGLTHLSLRAGANVAYRGKR